MSFQNGSSAYENNNSNKEMMEMSFIEMLKPQIKNKQNKKVIEMLEFLKGEEKEAYSELLSVAILHQNLQIVNLIIKKYMYSEKDSPSINSLSFYNLILPDNSKYKSKDSKDNYIDIECPFSLMAGIGGDIEIFKLLLEYNLIVDKKISGPIGLTIKNKNIFYSNIIGACAYYGNDKLLEYLLKNYRSELDVNFTTKEENSKKEMNSKKIKKELSESSSPLLACAGPIPDEKTIEILKILENYRANFENKDFNGNNIIHYAIKARKIKTLKFLVYSMNMETIMNEPNNNNAKPLDIAKEMKNEKIIKFLENYQKDDYGENDDDNNDDNKSEENFKKKIEESICNGNKIIAKEKKKKNRDFTFEFNSFINQNNNDEDNKKEHSYTNNISNDNNNNFVNHNLDGDEDKEIEEQKFFGENVEKEEENKVKIGNNNDNKYNNERHELNNKGYNNITYKKYNSDYYINYNTNYKKNKYKNNLENYNNIYTDKFNNNNYKNNNYKNNNIYNYKTNNYNYKKNNNGIFKQRGFYNNNNINNNSNINNSNYYIRNRSNYNKKYRKNTNKIQINQYIRNENGENNSYKITTRELAENENFKNGEIISENQIKNEEMEHEESEYEQNKEKVYSIKVNSINDSLKETKKEEKDDDNEDMDEGSYSDEHFLSEDNDKFVNFPKYNELLKKYLDMERKYNILKNEKNAIYVYINKLVMNKKACTKNISTNEKNISSLLNIVNEELINKKKLINELKKDTKMADLENIDNFSRDKLNEYKMFYNNGLKLINDQLKKGIK